MDVCFVAETRLRCDMEYMMTALGVARVIKSKPQMSFANTFPFVRTLLSVALMSAVVAPAYALEAMTDASMSNSTGEGIAYFANNFQLQMPSITQDGMGVGTLNNFGAIQTGTSNGSYNSSTGEYVVSSNPGDYGSYLYIGPVGPLPIQPSGGVAGNQVDTYLYGLSISGAGAAVNTTQLFTGTPTGWGSAADPFWLQVLTSNNYSIDGTMQNVPNVQVAAPTNTATAGNSLHLGMWLNIMQYAAGSKTPNYSTSTSTSATSATYGVGLGPALQIQGIWDGFGINGTVVNLFATPSCGSGLCPYGATGSITSAPGHGEYQNTLGLAGFLRFNSSRAGTSAAASSMLRLSVEGASGATTIGVFDSNEGVFIPQLNINLPLGNVNYQPLMLTSGVVSGNPTISLELAQIPNAPNVYNQFYVNYDSNGVNGIGSGPSPYANLSLCAGGTLSGNQCTTKTAYTYNGLASGADPSAITINTSSLVLLQSGTPNSSNNTNPATYQIGAYGLGNLQNVTGLTPATGSCVTGTASATVVGCPPTATHGSISIGDVYVNNTTSNVQKTYTLTLNDGTSPNGTTGTPNASSSVTVTDIIPPGGIDALFNSAGTAANSSVNGIYFQNSAGTQVNLGTAAISGAVINHMKMTLTGL